MTIAFVDSGLGGLPLVRSFIRRFPDVDVCYLGDIGQGPGPYRSLDAVARSGRRTLAAAVEGGALVVVLASHALAAALESLDAAAPVPVVSVVTAAADAAAATSPGGRIGLIGGRETVASRAYHRRLAAVRPQARVVAAACPLLVPLVAEGRLDKPETRMIVKKYLLPLKVRQIDTLIPASGHYAPLAGIIARKIGKRTRLVDPAEAAVDALAPLLAGHPRLGRSGRHRFLVSERPDEALTALARRLFGRNIRLTHEPW